MTVDVVLAKAGEEFKKILEHLKDEFTRLQVGRANPAFVENIPVEMYGSMQPVKALASINIPDPRTIAIQPWDKSALAAIEKAIVGAGIGLNPVNDGILVRISIPSLTEERRRDLTRVVHKLAEESKVKVRAFRQDAHNAFKVMKADNELTEDSIHGADDNLQAKVDEANEAIDELRDQKEKDIMTV